VKSVKPVALVLLQEHLLIWAQNLASNSIFFVQDYPPNCTITPLAASGQGADALENSAY
jgi:hypothetical protein